MKQNSPQSEQHTEQALQSLLRGSEESLPMELEQKLSSARRQAFVAADEKASRQGASRWPALGVAVASIALAAVLIAPNLNSPFVVDDAQSDYTASVDNELYQNLDFYQWLAESEVDNRG